MKVPSRIGLVSPPVSAGCSALRGWFTDTRAGVGRLEISGVPLEMLNRRTPLPVPTELVALTVIVKFEAAAKVPEMTPFERLRARPAGSGVTSAKDVGTLVALIVPLMVSPTAALMVVTSVPLMVTPVTTGAAAGVEETRTVTFVVTGFQFEESEPPGVKVTLWEELPAEG